MAKCTDCNKIGSNEIQNWRALCSMMEQLINKDGGEVSITSDCTTPLFTSECPASPLMTKQTELLDALTALLPELQAINANTDGLEVTTESIRIEAGQINLSTDQVEALLTDIKALATISNTNEADIVQGLLDLLNEEKFQLVVTDNVACVEDAGTFTQIIIKEISLFDVEQSSISSTVYQYSSDGTTWSGTAPTGTITLGACKIDKQKVHVGDWCVDGDTFRLYDTFNTKTGVKEKSEWFDVLNGTYSETAPTGTVVNKGGSCVEVATPTTPCFENKSYSITTGQTITFPANSLYSYSVYVQQGTANFTEVNNITTIVPYQTGESFGNEPGIFAVMPNPVIVESIGGNVKIMTIKACGVEPVISII